MNFIDTDLVAKIIFKILDLEIKNEIFNLASEDSIKIKNLKNILGFDSEYSDSAEKNKLSYYMNTDKIMKYAKLSKSQDAILDYYNSLKHD